MGFIQSYALDNDKNKVQIWAYDVDFGGEGSTLAAGEVVNETLVIGKAGENFIDPANVRVVVTPKYNVGQNFTAIQAGITSDGAEDPTYSITFQCKNISSQSIPGIINASCIIIGQ